MSEIATKVWNGTINCIITDGESEFYIKMHRNSYLPIYFNQLSNFFRKEVQWLEFEDVALAWNRPVGVIYDLMNGETPWRLKVHFDQYPDYILPLQDIEQYWLNQIKESCYIHNGNAKSIMTLSKQDTSSLWESVLNHDQSRWKCIYDKLKLEYKRIPLRVYLNDTKLDKVVQFHGQTLADTMHELLPELFPGTSSVITHGVEPPMDSPILELFQECVYIDGFLQLCVIIEAH